MFANVDEASRFHPAAKGRLRLSAALTIGIIAILIGLVILGFGYIGQHQVGLAQVRDQARVMRMARQAAMETNSATLDLMVRDGAEFLQYAHALNKLDSFGPNALPPKVELGTGEVSAEELLRGLKAAWADIAAAINTGQLDRARMLYATRDVARNMASLRKGFSTELDAKEAVYAATQNKIDFATNAVMLLQVLTGIVCILAFFLASRSSARDSDARDLAVSSANASREQVSRLFAMTDMLQSASDHSDANAVLRATAAELVPGFGGALYVFNNSRDRLTLSTSWQRDNGSALPEAIGLQQCWALKRGKPHINRPDSVKLCCEHHDIADHTLEIPMIARGEILGLLQIFAIGDGAEQRLKEVAGIGAALADAMSLALANIALRDKLRSQALRDPLTGLYNRRYMEDALERTVRLGEREKHEVSVIMIDLDHFKRLNDQHGHAKGDTVLRDAAAAITNQLRDTDIACRYGGEELIVVLPNCGLDMAAAKAERIRASIEQLSEPKGAQVSASFGVASAPSTSTSTRDLLANADAALYEAKQNGRNCVARAPVQSIQKLSPRDVEQLPVFALAAE